MVTHQTLTLTFVGSNPALAAKWFHGPVVMTLACHARDGGSIPPGTAIIGGLAQRESTCPASRGSWVQIPHPPPFAGLAQLVEQPPCKR